MLPRVLAGKQWAHRPYKVSGAEPWSIISAIEMKTLAVSTVLMFTALFIQAQTSPAAPQEACRKNISFAVAEGGQPVPDVPKFASKWISSKQKQHAYPDICFSQIPSSALSNYIVVLSSAEHMFEGLVPSPHTYTSATPASGSTAAVSSYGGTWSYAYVGVTPPSTTSTLDLGRDDKPKSLYARAYNQEGHAVARYTPSGGWFTRDKLMDDIVAAINGNTPPSVKQKPDTAALSVYYVNCDVDQTAPQSQVANPSAAPAADPAPAQPKPAPPPLPTLDVWSNPAGADVYLDGNYVGRTPYSATVPPGEHTIILRKRDFGTYERKVQVQKGRLKVGGYLEQRAITLQ